MSVTIRVARNGDSKGMGIVHVRAWQAAYRGVLSDDYLDGLSVEERVAMWERAIGLYGSEGWVDDGAARSEDVLGAVVEEMRYRCMLTLVA